MWYDMECRKWVYNMRGNWEESILIIVQRDATQSSLLIILQVHSTLTKNFCVLHLTVEHNYNCVWL